MGRFYYRRIGGMHQYYYDVIDSSAQELVATCTDMIWAMTLTDLLNGVSNEETKKFLPLTHPRADARDCSIVDLRR